MALKEIKAVLTRILTPATNHPELDTLISLFAARVLAITSPPVDGASATGTVQFGANPANLETKIINGVTVTFKDAPGAFPEVQRGALLPATLANLVTALNATANASISVATYSDNGIETLSIVHDAKGTIGNAFTLTGGTAAFSPSSSTLTGGADGLAQTKQAALIGTYSLANFIDPGDATASAAMGGAVGVLIFGYVTWGPSGVNQKQTFAVETGQGTGVYTTVQVIGQDGDAGNAIGGNLYDTFSFFVPTGRKWKHTKAGTQANITSISGIVL